MCKNSSFSPFPSIVGNALTYLKHLSRRKRIPICASHPAFVPLILKNVSTRHQPEKQKTPLLIEELNGRRRIYYKFTKGNSKLYWKWDIDRDYRGIIPLGLKSWLRSMFLPVGFPESVHHCYTRVHQWQALETLIGSAVSKNLFFDFIKSTS